VENPTQPSPEREKGTETQRLCSFCGKSEAGVEQLVAGPGVYICNECVEQCVEMLAEGRR
jgi:hypothetical protein